MLKAVSWLSGGTALAQIFSLISIPILTRLYTSEDYAKLAIITTIVAIATPVCFLGMQNALLIPHDMEGARGLTKLILISLITGSVTVGIVLELLSYFEVIKVFSDIQFLGIWVATILFLSGTASLSFQLAIRDRLYSKVATRTVAQGLGLAGSQTFFGLFSVGAVGLPMGVVVGNIIGQLTVLKHVKKYFDFRRATTMLKSLQEYWRFPTVFMPSMLMNTLSLEFPLLFLTMVYPPTEAGQLSMALRIAGIPLTLIGASIGQVMITEIAQKVRNQQSGASSLFIRSSVALGVLGILVVILVMAIGEEMVPFVLGEGWDDVYGLLVITTAITSLRMVGGSTAGVLSVLQNARATVLLDFLRFSFLIIGVVAVWTTRPTFDIAVIILYGGLAIIYMPIWLTSFFSIKKYERTL